MCQNDIKDGGKQLVRKLNGIAASKFNRRFGKITKKKDSKMANDTNWSFRHYTWLVFFSSLTSPLRSEIPSLHSHFHFLSTNWTHLSKMGRALCNAFFLPLSVVCLFNLVKKPFNLFLLFLLNRLKSMFRIEKEIGWLARLVMFMF